MQRRWAWWPDQARILLVERGDKEMPWGVARAEDDETKPPGWKVWPRFGERDWDLIWVELSSARHLVRPHAGRPLSAEPRSRRPLLWTVYPFENRAKGTYGVTLVDSV